ncbi:tail sheath [Yersinia phage fHe-Yen9-02]|nr:tail sheath [Yersinia phage fHe-Yen9-02]
MQYIKGRNFIGPEALSRDLVEKMITAGFTLTGQDGEAASGQTVTPGSKHWALDAGASVDSQVTTQPWTVIIRADNVLKTISIGILPKLQVTSQFEAASRSATEQVGRLSVGGLLANNFIDIVKDWKINPTAALAAYPLGYDLVTTDHGIALQIHAEGYDNTGTAFSWFVAQRGITIGETTAGEKSPLFCIYSCAGGQNGDPDVSIASSVLRYTVIEEGINSASLPISASQGTPDGMPIINPLQQVMIAVGNKACVLFPQMINSHRYVYFTMLDMLGYTSADVLSAASEIELSPTGTAYMYRGMNANGKDNRGMRVLFPIGLPA